MLSKLFGTKTKSTDLVVDFDRLVAMDVEIDTNWNRYGDVEVALDQIKHYKGEAWAAGEEIEIENASADLVKAYNRTK